MTVTLDHLVVAAATLDDGAAWCEATFGVAPAPGGKHPLMGTHNRLLAVSGAAHPRCYLEIIAIDPQAPPPGRARWFGLDSLDVSRGPRLVHWVARSSMLDMHRWGLINVGLQPGDPVAASRGALSWQLLVRADGALLCGGALPTLIQWNGDAHPADALPPSGVALRTLALRGVPDRARDVLRLRGVSVAAAAGDGPALSATFDTPRGGVTLDSQPGSVTLGSQP